MKLVAFRKRHFPSIGEWLLSMGTRRKGTRSSALGRPGFVATGYRHDEEVEAGRDDGLRRVDARKRAAPRVMAASGRSTAVLARG
jgi:hypothetical protein